MSQPDVEFIYALGSEPVSMGSGSFDDVARIGEEARQIDIRDGEANPRSTAIVSEGTRHFLRSLGSVAGVASIVTESVLAHYEGLVEGSRAALRRKLGLPAPSSEAFSSDLDSSGSQSLVSGIEEMFAVDTLIEVDRIQTTIRDIETKKTSTLRLVEFADNSDPQDFVVRYKAMMKIFEQFGVADAYYFPHNHPEIATETGDESGYRIVLRRPDQRGTFTVDFKADSIADRSANVRPVGRQVVYYKDSV